MTGRQFPFRHLESLAVIFHQHLHASRRKLDPDFGAGRLGVFYNIIQSFLHHPEDANLDMRFQSTFLSNHGDFRKQAVLFPKHIQHTTNRRRQAQIVQRHGTQIENDLADFGQSIANMFP